MPCLSDFRHFYAQFVVKDSSTGSVRLQFSKNASFVIKEGTDIVRCMCKGGGGGEYNHVWVKKRANFLLLSVQKCPKMEILSFLTFWGIKNQTFHYTHKKKAKKKQEYKSKDRTGKESVMSRHVPVSFVSFR